MMRQINKHIMIAAACFFVTALFMIFSDRGFWVRDNGHKFILLQQFLEFNMKSGEIVHPGKAIDTGGDFFPIPEPFAHKTGGRFYSQYPPLFPVVSSFFYRISGERGIYIIPFLSLLLTFVLLALYGSASWRLMLLLTAGSPVVFYGFVFWEHSAAVLLFISGLFFMHAGINISARIAGAACLILSILFREEAVLAVLSASFSLYIFSGRSGHDKTPVYMLLCAAGGITAACLFSGSLHYTGNLRPHGSMIDYLVSRLDVFQNLFLASHARPGINFILNLAFLVLFTVFIFWKNESVRILILWIYCSVILVFYTGLILSGDLAVQLLNSNGICFTWPVFILSLVLPAKNSACRKIYLDFIIFYAGMTCLLCPVNSSFGFHWSSRMLLFMVPVSILYLGHALSCLKGALINRPLAVICIISVMLQAFSLFILYERKAQNRKLIEFFEAAKPWPVITTIPWLAEELAPVYLKRQVFLLVPGSDASLLKQRLVSEGIKNIYFAGFDKDKKQGGGIPRLQMFDVSVEEISF